MKLGIDATNIGGGGGITHLKEILPFLVSKKEIVTIIVFSSERVLEQLINDNKVIKKSFPLLNKNLIHRVFFQLFKFDKEIYKSCDILFSITGDYTGKFKPLIGMSRNMLLYERDIWIETRQPKEIMRFWLNFLKQKKCFKNCDGIVFLSNHAKKIVLEQLNISKKRTTIIHHGIASRFNLTIKQQKDINKYNEQKPFRIIYVSTVHVYKHQWNVVHAIAKLRLKGIPIRLDLVGGVIFQPSGRKLERVIKELDPNNQFIKWHGDVPYDQINKYYNESDGIVFASTCENMPNILIESMASGLPIACSDKQPLPEFLKGNGFYFDAKDINSISSAIEKMVWNVGMRECMISKNQNEISNYSWEKTSNQTFAFIYSIYKNYWI